MLSQNTFRPGHGIPYLETEERGQATGQDRGDLSGESLNDDKKNENNSYRQERDRAQRGKLSLEQLQDIFRIYQVELEPRAVNRVLDQEEEITREDFVKLATETKLTEFQERDRSVVKERGGGERKVRDNYRNKVLYPS